MKAYEKWLRLSPEGVRWEGLEVFDISD